MNLFRRKLWKKILIIFVVFLLLWSFTMSAFVYAGEDEDESAWEKIGGGLLRPVTWLVRGLSDIGISFLQGVFMNSSTIKTDDTYHIKYGPGIIFSGKVDALSIDFFSRGPMDENAETVEIQEDEDRQKIIIMQNGHELIADDTDTTWKKIHQIYNEMAEDSNNGYPYWDCIGTKNDVYLEEVKPNEIGVHTTFYELFNGEEFVYVGNGEDEDGWKKFDQNETNLPHSYEQFNQFMKDKFGATKDLLIPDPLIPRTYGEEKYFTIDKAFYTTYTFELDKDVDELIRNHAILGWFWAEENKSNQYIHSYNNATTNRPQPWERNGQEPWINAKDNKIYYIQVLPTGLNGHVNVRVKRYNGAGVRPVNNNYTVDHDNFDYEDVVLAIRIYRVYTGEDNGPVSGSVAYSNSNSNIAYQLEPIVSTWYKTARRVAAAGLISVLLYAGIRIILSSAAGDKAKYKQMLLDWLTALCLLFIFHYIMVFVIKISQELTEIFSLYSADGDDVLLTTTRQDLETGNNSILRRVALTFIYATLVVLTYKFTIKYIKRVIYIAFLIMIAPLMALTYPLDKMKDGKAQGFTTWIREFIFMCLLQPLHALVYALMVGTSISLIDENPFFAIIAIGFLMPAEKFFKKMFGFDKSASVGQLGAAAAGAATMNAFNKLKSIKGHGGSKENGSPSKGNATNIRTANQNGPGSARRNGQNGANGTQVAGGAHNARQGIGASQTSTGNRSATGGKTGAGISAKKRIGGVIKAVGKRYKLWGSGSLRQWTKRVAGIAGAGTMAMIGGAAGLATGDLSNVLKYGGAGLATGYAGARGLVDKVADDGSGLIDTIKKGSQGEEL